MARKPSSSQPALPLPLPPVPSQPVYAVWPVRIESRESLDLAVAEVARCEAKADRVKAETKDRIAEVQRNALEQLVVELDGMDGPMTLADWRAAIEQGAAKFCEKYRDELLDEGRKSFDVNHGRVGWKDDPDALEPLDDFDEAGNDRLLRDVLTTLRRHLPEALGRFIDVKLAWRKKELLAAHLDQDLSLSVLKRAGFKVREERERFYITPRTNELASQSAERPKA